MAASNANNFDLIRLAAATQVAIHHSIEHLRTGTADSPILAVTGLFPGVPIFFFISGYLISKSFEKNPVPAEFALNRVVRIYPGLMACFFVSLAAVALTGYFATTTVSGTELLTWVAAQLSIAQFYNPEFMRNFGVGVLNGSLWTITVELQFYVLVPILYAVLRFARGSTHGQNRALIALALVFLLINQLYVSSARGHVAELPTKLVGVTFAPWFYMFVVGILFQRNHELLHGWLAGRFLPLLVAYCVVAFAASHMLGWSVGNTLNPLLFIGLSVVTFAAAFTRPQLSDKLLARNDVSYGVYIYHMPVVNCLLALGMGGGGGSLLLALAATFALAYASWRLIERPALGFKRHPLYQHKPADS